MQPNWQTILTITPSCLGEAEVERLSEKNCFCRHVGTVACQEGLVSARWVRKWEPNEIKKDRFSKV